MRVALLALVMGPVLAAPTIEQTDTAVIAQGETYRIEFSRTSGEFLLFARDKAGRWQGLVRDGGEAFWYGLNLVGREARTSQHKPEFTITERAGVPIIEVACRVSADPSIRHQAAYALLDSWVLCRSQLTCDEPLADAHIIRIGPRCDASTERFTHYAFRDRLSDPHEGAVADLGPPDKYVGVRTWGKGAVASDLSAEMPYLALHNPATSASIAFVYPMYERFWSDKHIFLQVYHDSRNYLYTGYGDRGDFQGEFPFCIYADSSGGVEGLEQAMPSILAETERMMDAGVMPIRALTLERKATQALDAMLPKMQAAWRVLERAPRDDEATRRLWLSRRLWRQAWLAIRAQKAEESPEFAREALRYAVGEQ